MLREKRIAKPARSESDRWRLLAAMVLSLIATGSIAVEHGFSRDFAATPALVAIQLLLSWVALYFTADLVPALRFRTRWRTRIGGFGEVLLLLAAGCELMGFVPAAEIGAVSVFVLMICRVNTELARSMSRPALLFPGSFLTLIVFTTLLLKLPAATPPEQPIGWIDATFTATSAVCVTGLVVRDTASGFTPFGQVVIALAIQLGGLGMMIFGSTLAMLFGGRLSIRENATLSAVLDEYPSSRISRFVWFIVIATLTIEAIAAIYLFISWPPTGSIGERAWQAVFHSISAFCNAGFDITGQSMVGLRWHPGTFLGILPLIILGGIGFVVLEDLLRFGRDSAVGVKPRRTLSTHTKLVLATTVLLIVSGTSLIFLAQLRVPSESIGHRVLDALFMSVTARTAGFNTVPMDELSSGSRFVIMTLMFIGGSPGGTAGGIKTTVFAVLVLAVASTIAGREEVEVFKRALRDALVKKAATVTFCVASLIALATLTLDLTETIPFEPLLFEVISATTTTGLSLGATSELSEIGRCVIVVTMFLGRVGPLAMVASLIFHRLPSRTYAYPRDSVSLG